MKQHLSIFFCALSIFFGLLSPPLAQARGGHVTSSHSSAPVHVSGYTTKNGTQVAPHYRSAPDGSKANNWSTKGNANPFTGKVGTKSVSDGSEGPTSAAPIQSQAVRALPNSLNTTPGVRSEAGHTEAVPNETPFSPPSIKFAEPVTDPILKFQQSNAQKKVPESMRAMGLRYLSGNGVPKDEAKGKELLQGAASKGDFAAKRKLRELSSSPSAEERLLGR
jgi:hypothetical protein